MPHEQWHTSSPDLWRKLKPEATKMRKRPTRTEDVLWQTLRNKNLGVRFRRQHAIGRFIADFCCIEAKLILEVDGGIHAENLDRDSIRDEEIGKLGYSVLRFSNEEGRMDLLRVRLEIGRILKERVQPHPRPAGTPSPAGEGE